MVPDLHWSGSIRRVAWDGAVQASGTPPNVLHTVPKEGACMVFSRISPCVWLEMSVVLFQVVGVVALCLSRLMPTTRWAERGRTWFVVALVGLGVAGALCGRHDSEFALFAGVTLTALLIGMTIGSGGADATVTPFRRLAAEANLAG